MQIQLLKAVTATTSAPSAATDGVPIRRTQASGQGLRDADDDGTILVASTAGSGTMSTTLRAWGYSSISGVWHPLGVGADATKGTLNNNTAIGETTADKIAHAELIQGVRDFERLYLQVVAITGSATAISAWFARR